MGNDVPALVLRQRVTSKHLYFFAVRADGEWAVDAVAGDLDESWAYEQPEVVGGLIAWDESGRSYVFEPRRDREGGPWHFHHRTDDPNELRDALRKFLLKVLSNRRHSRRAASAGIDAAKLESASLDALVDVARVLDLEHEY